MVNTVLQLAIEEKRQRRISRQNSLLKEATRRYSLVALVSPPIAGENPSRKPDQGKGKNSKKGSKNTQIDGTISPYSDVEGSSDKIQVKSKSSSSGPGLQNVPGNVLHEVSSDGSHILAGDSTALPVPRERVTIPSSVSHAHTHGQTMSESSSTVNLTATFGVPLMDSYLDSESDMNSEGDETSSGDDNRSRASTMTGTGSSMSALPKHSKKVIFNIKYVWGRIK